MPQIYTDNNGVQQGTNGSINVDSDTGMLVYSVIWFGDFDPAKVGGYYVIEGELLWSQERFNANQALKATVAAAEAAARTAATKTAADQTLSVIFSSATGTTVTEVQKLFAKGFLEELNLIRDAKQLPRRTMNDLVATIIAQKDVV